MAYSGNVDNPLDIINAVNDAIIADTHPPFVSRIGQLYAPWWAWLLLKRIDFRCDSPSDILGKPLKLTAS